MENIEIDEKYDNGNANKELRRNLVAFWIFGLCTNFGYVVMLSGAYDILNDQRKTNTGKMSNVTEESLINSTSFHCNPTSTAVILLADILPDMIIKLTAPFYMQLINYHVRIFFIIILITASLIIVAFSPTTGLSIFGVTLASASAGLGEITFLALSSFFKSSTISAWSSGTGMAGLAGAFAYAGLLQIGLSPRNTLLALLVVPFVWAIAFWGILEFPSGLKCRLRSTQIDSARSKSDSNNIKDIDKTKYLSLKEKFGLIQPLLKYMGPLFLVYLAEYTINQGLYEMLYYHDTRLDQAQQYRWFQLDYQLAVFISRSSVMLFRIKWIFMAAIFQCIILAVLALEVYFSFIPSIWISLAIIFLEGLLGGAVYVNSFFRISKEVPEDTREFSMGTVSVADACGITIAGLISIPIHNALCKLKVGQ